MNLLDQIKNKLGIKIDPAKQATLASVKAKTDLLTFDSGINPGELNVNVAAAVNLGVTDAAHGTPINPATKETLDSIQTQTHKLTFDNTSSLVTTGQAPALASAVNIKDQTQGLVNPASTEKVILLRRMAKLMESQATVDPTNSQRVLVDGFSGDIVTGTGISGPGVPVVTMSSDSATANAVYTAPVNYMGWSDQMFVYPARIAYAKNIRRNLTFS